jgi:hypothetical protein
MLVQLYVKRITNKYIYIYLFESDQVMRHSH